MAQNDERNVRNRKNQEKGDINTDQVKTKETADESKKNKSEHLCVDKDAYWLTRIVLLRAVSFIYFVAFAVAYNQNRALIGKNGLLPADQHLNHIKKHTKDNLWDMFNYAPTILWLLDYGSNIDTMLDYLAIAGMVLSALVLILGAANIPLMLVLWGLYHSIVNVGQRWYGFGWESQLLETGFLAVFLCPLFSMRQVPKNTPTSWIVIMLFRWLIFRIMIGAGLIKIRGDQCWRDLTCMNYHYETQPVPNPNSLYMHLAPEVWHQIETAGNHVVELIVPFFLWLPRKIRITGGIIQVAFQVVLIISGNLSFLNWLTIIPSLACFDDGCLSWMFSNKSGGTKWTVWALQREQQLGQAQKPAWSQYVRRVFNICLGCLIAYLSVPIVQNLFSSRQIMNTSFDPLRLVNTYGAFGSITKERTEVIFQGTLADNPSDPNAEWLEYEFKCKPGNVSRRPCLISPYHYRLDWLMWFAAFQSYQHNNWLVHLAAKFLQNDAEVSTLIAYNPFLEQGTPPKWVRAEHYRYTMPAIGSKAYNNGQWWKRRRLGEYLPPVNINSLKDYMKNMGWKVPRLHGGSKKKPRT